jgi:A/G-specific adenine glycosylase
MIPAKTMARRILLWFGEHARDLPWRESTDPYGIWVSEVMLQQTQVKTVIPYWQRWMELFPKIGSLAEAEPDRVLKAWEGLGYYSRARNLQKAARQICDSHGGRFPDGFEQVLQLPGVGHYTAGAICSIAFGQPTPILDGNVARVLARVAAVSGEIKSAKTRAELWDLSSKLVNAAAELKSEIRPCSALNQGLMELGATLCSPQAPQCTSCPLAFTCVAFRTGRVGQFPVINKRAKVRTRQFVAHLFVHDTSVLVRRRKLGTINAGLWEFPNVESGKPSLAHKKRSHFATIKHTITNNRITLLAFKQEVNGSADQLARKWEAEWRRVDQLDRLPFTSAHAKLRALLQKSG